ncbi:MAG: hypothetical protein KDB01_11450 [Planctomycetaceae bacterium]|nr:hypothetical protein [Planctomycetaceae bacterium]
MASSPYDISLNADVIHQIMNLSHKTGSNFQPGFAGGNVRPSAYFQGESPHSSSLSSTDLGTILALNSGTFIGAGLCIAAAVTSVPFRLRADCGTFASGASHSAIQCSNTLATLESISGKINESAKADMTLRYKSADGFVSPVSFVGSITLADATFVAEYQLHSIVVNGVTLAQIQGVDISTGIKVIEQKSSGPFATAFYINEGLPTISIQTEDVAYAGSVINAAGLGTGIAINFAKRAASGIIVDPEDEEHITISGAVGIGQAETVGGDARTNASNTIKINPLSLTAAVGVALA